MAVTVVARASHRGALEGDLARARVRVETTSRDANADAKADGERALVRDAALLDAVRAVLPRGEAARAFVITHAGEVVTSSERLRRVAEGDVVTVERRGGRRTETGGEKTSTSTRAVMDDTEDDDAVVELRGRRRRVETFLRRRCGLSRWTANALARAPALEAVAWWLGLRQASARDLAPPYVLFTGFALIVMNLGRRRPGEPSAYSIFNDRFERLPGQFTADDVDDVVMRRR
ncbi:Uncharacterised domain SAYSvFN [Ostreococcus tauri]|uniref:Uncharacterized domain SAYSvFN n=1 Tax=Ostreococcus tauri TaxID=70448 RepID=A0A096PA39_OSTTA|nr:Uncharacterised domain SAYSvFN [Ostreococcus tauri]CEG00797.1 Uncharacterised domain SAYSvFN [Ostreococcus tauri]|eukprot:XP_003084229.2 Uncharacterised domain SAYSvFN [Ostreococcus tauri]